MQPRSRLAHSLPTIIVLALAVSTAPAGIVYDEGVDGDFSGDRFNPTDLVLSEGVNLITATSIRDDREYVTLTIPAGLQLDSLVLVSYVGLDETAFIGVQAGDIMSEPSSGANPANLLGWTHFGPGAGNVGADILPEIGMGFDAIGFTPPLPGGDYTFWIQQTGTSAATYTMAFNVSPEPASLVLLSAALMFLRRRR